MTSWDEFEAALEASHEIAVSGPGWLGLQHASGQRMHVTSETVLDEAAVVIRCPVSHETLVDARVALAHGASLGLGTLVLHRNQLVLQATLLLRGLTQPLLARALEALSAEALRIHRRLHPRLGLSISYVSTTFHAYAD